MKARRLPGGSGASGNRVSDGHFVLENTRGEVVRAFLWEEDSITLVARHDNGRIETVVDENFLKESGKISGVDFKVLAVTTKSELKKQPIEISGKGRLKWIAAVTLLSPQHELAEDLALPPKKAAGWSLGIQLGMAALFVIAGFFSGSQVKKSNEVSVTLLTQDTVQKMMRERPEPGQTEELPVKQAATQLKPREIVVAPTIKKIRKNAPVPTHSTSFKRTARQHSKAPRGGGYKSEAPRGYGTNEKQMNSIGALAALHEPRVRGGNGGRGGLNLQAVGKEPGSGAGGKGHGGFGTNGGGGKGLGGLGSGRGQGLSNAMYGKGLVAAPFGDGSPAPGSGGYGTRGKMGGGAQGAGYGTQTIVGSWKGTGPKGDGPAGSGVGNGDPNGSPFGSVDGEDDDAVVTGGLDMESIREIIYRNMGQIRYCYEQGLQRQPALSGRVTVKWQISGNGRVSLAGIRHSSVRSAQVESCMVSKIKNWHFPKPHGGVNVAVVYPFNLQRTVSMR